MLETVKARVADLVSNRKFLIILICTAIFICAAVYVYKTYVTPKLNPSYVENKEYINKGDAPPPSADIYFFYTTWCPHCKTAMPVWKKFKESIGEKKVKDTRINFIEIDCDKDTATADKFKVDGYPTIKLVHGNRVIEYDAKPSLDTLSQFLNTSL